MQQEVINKELQVINKTIELWSRSNTELFDGVIDFSIADGYHNLVAAMSNVYDEQAYKARMLLYVKGFNQDKYSNFKMFTENGLITIAELAIDSDGDVNFSGTREDGYVVNDWCIPQDMIPIFSSYMRKAELSLGIDNDGDYDEKVKDWVNTDNLKNSCAEIHMPPRNPGKTLKDLQQEGRGTRNKDWYTTFYDYETGKQEAITVSDRSTTIPNTFKKGYGNMNTYDIKNDAKSSLKLATDLAKGRTALATVHGMVTKVIPMKWSWLARVTGKDKAITNSPYTKLAAAAVAHAIATQFDNEVVTNVTKLAQDAALIEVAGLIPIEDFVAQLTDSVVDKASK